ncbi:MAG TPA: hypothetical protein VJ724_00975, partial [Tahibacter sp.]|nr:hypothetical protein [Tahibacter sp.]
AARRRRHGACAAPARGALTVAAPVQRSSGIAAWFAAVLLVVALPAWAVVVPDPAFGDNGHAYITGFDGIGTSHVHVAPMADGTYVFALAGPRIANGANLLLAGRLRSDGAVDTTFGGGIVQLPIGSPAHTVALARLLPLADGGAFVFVRMRRDSGLSDALLLRFSRDGKFFQNFNHGQPLTVPLPLTPDMWTAYAHGDGFLLATQPWPRTLFSTVPITHSGALILRFAANGSSDEHFGLGGLVELPDQPGRFGDLMLRADGRFQILHTSKRPDGNAANRWRSYLANGTIDTAVSSGWHDVGDDGRRHLVSVFALDDGRYAVANDESTLVGYLDAAGRMTTPMNFPDSAKAVQPFSRGRVLVGLYRESGFIPTPFHGAFAVAVDANGEPDARFAPSEEFGMLRVPAPLHRYNFASDSPWSFVVAGYHESMGVRITRYLEIRGDGGTQPVPATGAPALLFVAGLALLIGATRLRRERKALNRA